MGTEARLGRRAAQLAIRGYQLTLSGLAGRTCRHLPSCSDYTAEAIGRHGIWAGSWIGLARICRCGPGGTSGLDFVCEELPSDASWATPWRYGRWRRTNEAPPRAGVFPGGSRFATACEADGATSGRGDAAR